MFGWGSIGYMCKQLSRSILFSFRCASSCLGRASSCLGRFLFMFGWGRGWLRLRRKLLIMICWSPTHPQTSDTHVPSLGREVTVCFSPMFTSKRLTRMHYSRMRTARSLLWGVSLTDPPGQTPPPGHPLLYRSPWTETPHPGQGPPLVMWPVVHAGTETSLPPPCRQNSWHTLVKTLPCRDFVAGGKNYTWMIFVIFVPTSGVKKMSTRNYFSYKYLICKTNRVLFAA